VLNFDATPWAEAITKSLVTIGTIDNSPIHDVLAGGD
jgi:hypothetical protein